MRTTFRLLNDLREEYLDLTGKIDRASWALAVRGRYGMSAEQAVLLEEQIGHMRAYAISLKRRAQKAEAEAEADVPHDDDDKEA